MEAKKTLGPAGILAMNPEGFREIDGVVLDLESYEKHRTPPSEPVLAPRTIARCEQADKQQPQQEKAVEPTQPPAQVPLEELEQPHGVFITDPVHVGWYETAAEKITYPIMAGAVYPCSGSGQGSFVTSWMTSYFIGSWFFSSGSWFFSSRSWGSSAYLRMGSVCFTDSLPGGYGLELI